MSSAMNASLKVLHDKLLAERPEGVVHEPEGCPLCAMTEGANGETMTTFSEDEVTAKIEAAVTAAVAERDAKIAELSGAVQTNETAQAVAGVRAELEPKLVELQQALDQSVIEATNLKAERDAIVAWLEAEKTAAEHAVEVAARLDGRMAKVKETVNFPDEYLEKNAERIAAMSDDDFAVTLESWAVATGARPGPTIPSQTGLHAARDGVGSERPTAPAIKELFAMRRERGHVDLSTL